jgi:anion-transporting  ArsA/GET3 family ATPase
VGVRSLLVVVGAGGVGKTTLAAALGVVSARRGDDTLVMTFDPSLRLKDALGVGEAARRREVEVAIGAPGRLAASLLDARATFDRLVGRYSPDDATRDRILHNRFYDHLSGSLGGVLEYMAVERLFEVASESGYQRIVLDTPPTRQALDFLEAPDRIIGFLDSGAVRIALRPWFDEKGRLRPTRRLGVLGRSVETFLDNAVGLDLLRDMAEFFQVFGPLYDGFRRRAREVQDLLTRATTQFVLVSGPALEAVPDTMFFARSLAERRHRLGIVVVNRINPIVPVPTGVGDEERAGLELLAWQGRRDGEGVAALRSLLGTRQALAEIPLLGESPGDLAALERFATIAAPSLAPILG